MSGRRTSEDEKREFEQDYREARPIQVSFSTGPGKKKGNTAGMTGINGATEERLRKGQMEPDAKIDLHGKTEGAAHQVLAGYLRTAAARGHKLVLVVTGKGNPRKEESASWMQSPHGVLKQMVPRWLNEPELAPLIASVRPAHVRHGGDGALYVYLRKSR